MTLSNYGTSRTYQDNTPDWITSQGKPDAYTEELCKVYRSSKTFVKLANDNYTTDKPSRKSQCIFAFNYNILHT